MKRPRSSQTLVAAPRQSAAVFTFPKRNGGALPRRRCDNASARIARLVAGFCIAVVAANLSVAEPGTLPLASGSDPPEAALKQRATAIAKEAFSELSSNLLAAITRSGLNEALPYCSENAMPITKAVAGKNGVGLSRVTHKPRNPVNQATDAELALLRKYQKGVAAKREPTPVTITNANQTVSVYVPIVIPNALCLMCHGQPGTEISTELQATIRKLYPKDEATGFALGDLRGAWRLDFIGKPAVQSEGKRQ